MSQLTNNKIRLAYVSWLIDEFRQHPSMRQIELLKDQLKREKQEDQIFYQSIKAKLATC